MKLQKRDIDWLFTSERLYKNLLLIYPAGFRQAYGSLMTQVFADQARRSFRESGKRGLITWWGRTMLDTIQTAIEEYAQQGVDMSKAKFEKLSGWALILAGLVMFLGWLSGTRPEYDPYNYFSLWIDQYANALLIPLIIAGSFFLIIGYAGLLIRFGSASGRAGRFGLGMGIAGGLVSFVGIAGMIFSENELWWTILTWGFLLLYSGLAVFGIVCLTKQVLPRWNGLPLLGGIWLPLYMLYAMISETVTGTWAELPVYLDVGIWLISFVGLAGIGYLLQQDRIEKNLVPTA